MEQVAGTFAFSPRHTQRECARVFLRPVAHAAKLFAPPKIPFASKNSSACVATLQFLVFFASPTSFSAIQTCFSPESTLLIELAKYWCSIFCRVLATMAKKVALVTGGNKGIGFGVTRKLCERLPKDSWVVLLGTRDVSNGERALTNLKECGLPMLPVVHQLDITDSTSCKQMKDFIHQKYGGLDLLVNNSGFAFKRNATESKYEQAKHTIGVNYFGTKQITETVLPIMRDGARIISVASMCGKMGLEHMSEEHRRAILSPDLSFEKLDDMMKQYIEAAKTDELTKLGWPESTYEMSKAGVIAATELWAQAADKNALTPQGTKGMFVACCCPGWCRTDMAGYEHPPLSADEGAERVVDLCLAGGDEEQGQFLMEKKVVPLSFPQKFSGKTVPCQQWLSTPVA
ncbi:putative carbonyl reductase 1 [Toxoplasma gondii TgCatPRC2]|uniref:Carbonyl reductase 1, putative n=3 Tax=Toxoplasma gondii TaxID=5811 RepID=S8F089_TOXGM|nr:carbonyl reductase 1, putative [Toxoplasma gondii ME49]EPT28047.1 carbonyl reductase 1, putative [Toxoplasma gondii ME49]KYF45019.1 putative carbonyl reductase 1 [Toxoplasma gondii ARI]KYK69678.1 putative carbonyl reductase 1 [Toxoplasma gondii TgCatPRC2]|eukprot:XP_002368473.2 carbonyl reductase 1, putative [Toxoplasma gondii ME49]